MGHTIGMKISEGKAHHSCSRKWHDILWLDQNHIYNFHSPDRDDYRCEECNISFTQKYSVKKHIDAVHKQIRPYQCPNCEKSFSRKLSLKRHTDAIHPKLCGEEKWRKDWYYLCNKLQHSSKFFFEMKLRLIESIFDIS